MPKTAFSSYYARELDPEQLLALMQSGLVTNLSPEVEITSQQRDWIRTDVVCPSCGAIGAQIVKTSKRRSSASAIRQAHFRFVSSTGDDAHHKFCEFNTDAEEKSNESLINFSNERSNETRFIRNLVCKGIEQEVFDQGSIRAMRQWFFDLKVATRIRVTATSAAVSWLKKLDRHPFYFRWPFQPVHAEMPNFDWQQAARYQFTEDNFALLEWLSHRRRKSGYPNNYKRAELLREKHYNGEVFDTSVLQPYYRKAVSLAVFVASNSVFPNKKSPQNYRSEGPPPALLALCALVLSVSEWDTNGSIECFSKILNAPDATDKTLGNVIGLNPFHDYQGWGTLAIASELAERSSHGLDYDAQLCTIKLRLQEEHRAWQAARQIDL